MKIKGDILANIKKLMKYSKKELLARSLEKNTEPKDNYKMVMDIKIIKALNTNSLVMGIMTFLILVLTWCAVK